jgi:hypothetical protein
MTWETMSENFFRVATGSLLFFIHLQDKSELAV